MGEVRAIIRRPLEVGDPRLHVAICEDFAGLEPVADALEGVDAVFFALGISAGRVDGEEQYRRITHDYALAAGRAVRERSPAAVFHFISGAGTNASSRMMWARVKGETEIALGELGLGGLVCWRPAMILADKLPKRLSRGYRLAHLLFRGLAWASSLTVHNVALGQAMLQATFEGLREGTLTNREIRAAAARYRSAATSP